MTTDYKDIEVSALQLDEKQRAELARRLLVSLETYVDENIDQAWIDEVNRRKKQVESGEVDTIPANEVHEKARNLLNK